MKIKQMLLSLRYTFLNNETKANDILQNLLPIKFKTFIIMNHLAD